MISVDEALARLFALAPALGAETVPLRAARGRVLAQDAVATRNQPPFAASAMDGYAVRIADAVSGAVLSVIGEAPAGQNWPGTVGSGQAVRIFTGAPVPLGAERIVIQEDTTRDGERITLTEKLDKGPHIRPAGADFREGQTVIPAATMLGPAHVALLAALNLPTVQVYKRPEVAILCTGDELVMPGEAPRDDQIIASNGFGLAALFEAAGAATRLLPIAADTPASLTQAFEMARGSDLIVPCGGASVGDHDLVAPTLQALGATLDFHKIAIRPGKPVMAGRLWDTPVIGLPGNPVSAMVCGVVFVLPVIRALQGLPAGPAPRRTATLTEPLGANGPRAHYMRARLTDGGIAPLPSQDSALLSALAAAHGLLIRPPLDPARAAGETVDYIPL